MAVPSVLEFHWQSLARLPSGRVYHSLSEVGGQMYMLGGCDAAGRPCPAMELYSPEGDRWMTLPPMPTPRAGAAVAVLGKQILVVGGVGEDQSPLKVVEMYNTEEGSGASVSVCWNADKCRAHTDLLATSSVFRTNLPILDTSACSFIPSETNGGRQCKRPVKAFEVYDAETRSWTTLPIMLCKRSYGGVIWDPTGRLCLLGGLRQGGGHQSSKFTKNVNIFDTNQERQDSEATKPKSEKENFCSICWENRKAPSSFPFDRVERFGV
ncbi:Kelch domain-containing protein 8A [Liparis tanakae]|uniref:Kelch domain-containing protein 8A n=1 Tax=Liparis tanakae TaxID=230148 RepID=A0A4Z2FVR6_9TELE|nr:Kelch domain-containing protein 8A [Liparis tanakae]